MITDYVVITDLEIWNLTKKVKEYISKGYTPLGGVSSDGTHLYQAMIKEVK